MTTPAKPADPNPSISRGLTRADIMAAVTQWTTDERMALVDAIEDTISVSELEPPELSAEEDWAAVLEVIAGPAKLEAAYTESLEIKARIDAEIEKRRPSLLALDADTVNGVVGVAHSTDLLRKALQTIELHLGARDLERCANAGYEQVGPQFIFLQRTLGTLNELVGRKEVLIQEIAEAADAASADVAPLVKAALASLKPRGSIADESGHL
jgi:hypothetical protein